MFFLSAYFILLTLASSSGTMYVSAIKFDNYLHFLFTFAVLVNQMTVIANFKLAWLPSVISL